MKESRLMRVYFATLTILFLCGCNGIFSADQNAPESGESCYSKDSVAESGKALSPRQPSYWYKLGKLNMLALGMLNPVADGFGFGVIYAPIIIVCSPVLAFNVEER